MFFYAFSDEVFGKITCLLLYEKLSSGFRARYGSGFQVGYGSGPRLLSGQVLGYGRVESSGMVGSVLGVSDPEQPTLNASFLEL